MARSSRVNVDNRIKDALINLKRHMDSCNTCAAARKGGTPRDLCETGIRLILAASDLYGDVLKLRIKAHSRKDATVYACPDLTKHGPGYAMTATPLFVQYAQDGMF